MPILIQVNIGAEATKAGVLPEALPELAQHILSHCAHLELRGLMTIPPADSQSRRWFAALRTLRDDTGQSLGVELPELSMGMSGDYREAIEEGATIVRLGTALFGPRPAAR